MPWSWVFIKPRQADKISIAVFPASGQYLDPPLDYSAAEVAEQLNLAPDVRSWHIASFRCAVEFGRYRGMANSANPSPAVTGRHGGGFFWAGAGWVALHGAAFLGGGPLGPPALASAHHGRLDHLYWLTSRHGAALVGAAADAHTFELVAVGIEVTTGYAFTADRCAVVQCRRAIARLRPAQPDRA